MLKKKMKLFKSVILYIFNKRVVGFLLFIFSAVMPLAFITYDFKDASWFYADNYKSVNNFFLNNLMANTVMLVFHFLGYGGSYLLILFLLYISFLLLFNISFKKEWERIFAAMLLILTISALLNFYNVDLFSGGLVGKSVNTVLLSPLDEFIVLVVLLSTLWISLCLITRLSFVRLMPYFKIEKLLYPFKLILRPFVLMFNWIRNILNGSDISKSGKAIYEFEGGEFMDLTTSMDNDFWKEFLNQREVDFSAQNFDLNEQNGYRLPTLEIFTDMPEDNEDPKRIEELEKLAVVLEEKLEKFGVFGKVVSIKSGPVITLFEYKPQIDSKISKIVALEDDLALALRAVSIRIIAPIPGKAVIGFEISNRHRKNVFLASIIKKEQFFKFNGELPLIFGHDIIGHEVVVDLVKMPHLLIAGSTGAGKSVSLNTMLVSLLCRLSPDDLKIILIDPKRLEFSVYSDIAHLVFPIVTDSKRAILVLRWVVKEMERRYEKISKTGVRNIQEYRSKSSDSMPYIVVIIDELADLMMTAGKEIEDLIARIAQMARAAGIHLIVATQRPSVDVITGLIKVNFPSRISFRVTSKVDSRTILDCVGADKLLGRGDMLFLSSNSSVLKRVHGAYVSDKEIESLVNHIKAERKVEYLDIAEEITRDNNFLLDEDEDLYQDVIKFLDDIDEVSISMLQRKFRIGYNRSARIIDMLESQGRIMPSENGRPRKIVR